MKYLSFFSFLLFVAMFDLMASVPKAYAADTPEVTLEASEKLAKDVQEPLYLRVDPITVNVLQEGMVMSHMTYVMVFEVESEDDKDMIRKFMPRLKHAYLSYMQRLAGHATKDRLDDFEFLRTRIKKITNRVIGEEIVNHVLFKTKAVQNFG